MLGNGKPQPGCLGLGTKRYHFVFSEDNRDGEDNFGMSPPPPFRFIAGGHFAFISGVFFELR